MNLMPRFTMPGLWRTVRRCILGGIGIGLLTFFCFHFHVGFDSASFCYLLFLVTQSLSGDFISSAVISCLAVGCLDYFFLEPLFSLQIENPLDTLGLASFLITGLIITKLVTKVRTETELSRLHHERLQQLYDLSQQLLALDPGANGGRLFLNPFRGVFGIRGLCLFDVMNAGVYMVGQVDENLEKKAREAFIQGKDCEDSENGSVLRCIRVGGRTIGAIGFEGLKDPDLTADPLTALAAAHLERAHSFVRASQAAAIAQTETYRSAILDALAHEFKTPLSTILTAAGALRQAQPLGVDHREMAEIVESEATRLSRLTSRLIRTARLEQEEVRPWIELIDVSSVIADTVDQYARLSADRTISVFKHCESSAVMADPDLLRLAVSQLLDNACKYSWPGSVVTLTISREYDQIAVRVLSRGNPIPTEEQSKIFDRFYRGTDARQAAPGSGLGLFVARKIALALGGDLKFESNPTASEGSVFRLVLPVSGNESDSAGAAI